MNAKKFVSLWKSEKESMLSSYFDVNATSEVSMLINKMNLTEVQNDKMKEIIDAVLIDTFYNLLLGLDGESQIGGIQESYKIYDEAKNLISKSGELEAEAYEQFQS